MNPRVSEKRLRYNRIAYLRGIAHSISNKEVDTEKEAKRRNLYEEDVG